MPAMKGRGGPRCPQPERPNAPGSGVSKSFRDIEIGDEETSNPRYPADQCNEPGKAIPLQILDNSALRFNRDANGACRSPASRQPEAIRSIVQLLMVVLAIGLPQDSEPGPRKGCGSRRIVDRSSSIRPAGRSRPGGSTTTTTRGPADRRLLGDEWPKVEQDFREMKELGRTSSASTSSSASSWTARSRPERARRWIASASCWTWPSAGALPRPDRPGLLPQEGRARLVRQALENGPLGRPGPVLGGGGRAVCRRVPAVFCYDLMNEPVVPGGKRKDGDWLARPSPASTSSSSSRWTSGPAPARHRPPMDPAPGRRDPQAGPAAPDYGRPGGLEPGPPGLTSGFVPDKIADDLDFISVHLYPEGGQGQRGAGDARGLRGRQAGGDRGDVSRCRARIEELRGVHRRIEGHAAGWIGFYWGRRRKSCAGRRRSRTP